MKKNLTKLAVASAVLMSSVGAFAGVLTDDVTFDLGDYVHIYAGLVAAGVVLYGIKKAIGLLHNDDVPNNWEQWSDDEWFDYFEKTGWKPS